MSQPGEGNEDPGTGTHPGPLARGREPWNGEDLHPSLARLCALAKELGNSNLLELNDQAEWDGLCPDRISDRYHFFRRLAGMLTHTPRFLKDDWHFEKVDYVIREQAARLVDEITSTTTLNSKEA